MIMNTNYHTHTARCGHAQGEDRAYVEAAVSAGFRVLGFADHTPYPGVSEMIGSIRMPLEQTADYFASLTALRQEFADRIELHIGFEAEYFPDLFGGLLDFLAQYPCEYLILGQHFSAGTDPSCYYGRPTEDEAVLAGYVDRVVAGIETGKFSYVAHPDLCPYNGPEAVERKHFLRLCHCAREYNLPLEVNVEGWRGHRAYPRESFFHVAREVGNTLIMGADAHSPERLAQTDALAACRTWAEQFGLPIVQTIPMGKVQP